MERRDFLYEQFLSLRREIEGLQGRLFWTVVIGLLGLPTLTYVTWEAKTLAWLVLPYLVLVVVVLFLAQHHQMMRAGRYIRERIEEQIDSTVGWEAWLESRPELRIMDRHFFACFTLIFFGYYFFLVIIAMHRLWVDATNDPSGLYWARVYGAASGYIIATLWAVVTLIHHWRSSTTTRETPDSPRHHSGA